MMYSFHPQAEKELNEAIDYYNEHRLGLGREFANEVSLSIRNIIDFPRAWTPFSRNTRRYLTNRFPFGIIYQISQNQIFVVAVMHLSRKPGYWEDRLN